MKKQLSPPFVPPIKCQGKKTKLVPFILSNVTRSDEGLWVEPFMGSGVVGFNAKPSRALFADSNPHIIAFYEALNTGAITPQDVKEYLQENGAYLSERGKEYYYEIRDRFNAHFVPLDFLFINRSCFNGVMRFNRKGGFNVPFNHKPDRYSKSFITRVTNQVKETYRLCQANDWRFVTQDFKTTLSGLSAEDFVYCDPPYAGRHASYYSDWTEDHESDLAETLTALPCRFMLSTWYKNKYRENPYLEKWQGDPFRILYAEHFYHVGASENNRAPMIEAAVVNYEVINTESDQQLELFNRG